VIAKSAAESKLNKIKVGQLVGFSNIELALFKLISGDVDAFVFSEPVLKQKMRLISLDDNHIKVVGKSLMELKRGFLVIYSTFELFVMMSTAFLRLNLLLCQAILSNHFSFYFFNF